MNKKIKNAISMQAILITFLLVVSQLIEMGNTPYTYVVIASIVFVMMMTIPSDNFNGWIETFFGGEDDKTLSDIQQEKQKEKIKIDV